MNNDGIAKNTDAEPKAEAGGGFKILVTFNGAPIGWLTVGGPPEYWVTLTDNEASASVWYQVASSGKTYIMTAPNNYLSLTSTLRLVMRVWAYAAAWQPVGSHLKCVDNGKFVTTDGSYFYANGDPNGDNLVDVKYVQN